jgi:hypothetical protein
MHYGRFMTISRSTSYLGLPSPTRKMLAITRPYGYTRDGTGHVRTCQRVPAWRSVPASVADGDVMERLRMSVEQRIQESEAGFASGEADVVEQRHNASHCRAADMKEGRSACIVGKSRKSQPDMPPEEGEI